MNDSYRHLVSRTTTITDVSGEVTTHIHDITWKYVREARDAELKRTDWWGLSDLGTMSAERANYRVFLRDMPANYSSANDAADAWLAYDMTGL